MHVALSSDQAHLRLLATALAGRAGSAGLPVLEAALGAGEPAMRQIAVQGLVSLGPNLQAVDALARAARDEDKTVREIAFLGLGRAGKAAMDPLRRLIKEQDPELSRAAMRALGEASQGTGIPVLEPGVARHHPDPLHAIAAAEASVRTSGDPGRGLGDLIVKLDHEDAAVRAEAATSCGRLMDHAREATARLQQIVIQDPASEARRAAATALAMIGGGANDSVSVLTGALRDPDKMVRRTVIVALAALDDVARPAVPALRALLQTMDDESDQEMVKAALRRIQGE